MIAPLAWDSAHFGFAVARLEPDDASASEIETELAAARERGVRLVYHHRPDDDALGGAWLADQGGLSLSASVLYEKSLDVGRRDLPEGVTVEDVVTVSEGLRAFVPQCGPYSRFRLDPNVPKQAFVSLYEVWLERSVAGDIADRVLSVGNASGRELGLVTIARVDAATGRIGLIGVREDSRGSGLGTALVVSAEQAMEDGGAERAQVSTHIENTEACRLFESFGYQAGAPKRAYHFWLEADA